VTISRDSTILALRHANPSLGFRELVGSDLEALVAWLERARGSRAASTRTRLRPRRSGSGGTSAETSSPPASVGSLNGSVIPRVPDRDARPELAWLWASAAAGEDVALLEDLARRLDEAQVAASGRALYAREGLGLGYAQAVH
jgi:hypothetical protein